MEDLQKISVMNDFKQSVLNVADLHYRKEQI